MARYADLPRCGMTVSRLSRGGRITHAACRNPVRAGQPRCWKHLDLFAWAASERKVREARRRKLAAKDHGWSLKKLAALREDRQLGLLAWGDAYEDAYTRRVRALVDERVDADEMPTLPTEGAGRADWDTYGWAWDRYERRKDERSRAWKQIAETARLAAERAVLEAGWPGWRTLRWLVYERDRGVCFVCDRPVPFEAFELGHLQDRMMGGSDRPDNVVVMCYGSNHARKPLHETADAARQWAAVCRTRFRQIWNQVPMSHDEFLEQWARLGPEQRDRLMEEAFTWTDQVEEALVERRRWLAEHPDSDEPSA